ncbi:MAG: TIGR00730 family Rossman fold protein [Xylophilus ampelinus]
MRICVFCGSSPGRLPAYREAAVAFGELLADQGIGLVYGGASVGLMGAVADAARGRGGEVIGVIPRALADRELAHPSLTELHVVGSMHERKAMMAELSDAFVALPGGIGTLEELFEVWTWAQLGHHRKACGLLDTAGYYSALTGFLDHIVAEGFMKPVYREMLRVERTPGAMLEAVRAYAPPDAPKWIGPRDT